MEKRVLLVCIFALLLTLSFVIAEELTDDEKVDEAYACLEDRVYGKCSSLPSEDRVFALLAVEECENEVLSDSKYKADIKFTAQAILGLDNVYVDVTDAADWLFTQKDVPTGLEWFLQIENPDGETSCTVENLDTGGTHTVTIREDRKIGSASGGCLSKSDNGYWLEVSSSCYNQEFEITCDKRFSTNLLYKERDSETIYVSSETHGSKGGENEPPTYETVDSICFGRTSCDYEGSLWAAFALDSIGEEVSSYLPYLIASADENSEHLPEAFLYYLTGDFRADLLGSQKRSKYWLESGDKYYDTALALFVLTDGPAEITNAKDWLLETQDTSGCWGGVRNTAFILSAAWPDWWMYVDECHSDDECDSDEDCIDAICVYIECRNDGDCESDEDCIDAICVYIECRGDGDCDSDEECIDNECEWFECQNDNDCEIDEVCIDTWCDWVECKVDGDCDSDEICVDNACIYEVCTDDSDCDPDQTCVYGICEPPETCDTGLECNDNYTCVDGECVFEECASEFDCNDDEICVEGSCEYEECSIDDNCEPDEICEDGSCNAVECTDDLNCESDELCIENECEYQECFTSADCNSDYICISGDCIYDDDDDGVIDCEWDFQGYCISSIDCDDAGGDIFEHDCSSPFICCNKDRDEETCSDLGGKICYSDEICSGGDFISTYDVKWGEECCVGGTCDVGGDEDYDCEDNGGDCRYNCYDGEEKDSSYTCEYGDDCCFDEGGGASAACSSDYDCASDEKCEDGDCVEEGGSLWWVWVLVVLIVLAVLGIIFKDKVREFLIRIKSKGKKKGPPGFPHRPGRFLPSSRRVPLRRPMPRRIMPPSQHRRMPIRRLGGPPPPGARPGVKPGMKPGAQPRPKPKGEVEEVLKKLKEIGK